MYLNTLSLYSSFVLSAQIGHFTNQCTLLLLEEVRLLAKLTVLSSKSIYKTSGHGTGGFNTQRSPGDRGKYKHLTKCGC